MTTDIRVLDSEGDLVAAANLFRTAMIGFQPLLGLAPGQITTLLERGRTIGAFVKDQLVGTADAVTSGLTLPGGTIVGHAAVTHVGVLPSFTRKGIGRPSQATAHQVHAPEIELTSPTTARGVWALQDVVRFGPGVTLVGYGHYHETYENIAGQWLIKSSKLTRLREDIVTPVISFHISGRVRRVAAKLAGRLMER